MGIEKTFGIIKPDAVRNNKVGAILAMIEGTGLRIKGLRYTHLTRPQAEGFYAVHKERPFFGELVEFMTSGPCVVYVLEGEEAITRYRGLMGATNPADADEGTIRKAYAASIGENAVHGSDATDTAAFEINWFFQGYEVA